MGKIGGFPVAHVRVFGGTKVFPKEILNVLWENLAPSCGDDELCMICTSVFSGNPLIRSSRNLAAVALIVGLGGHVERITMCRSFEISAIKRSACRLRRSLILRCRDVCRPEDRCRLSPSGGSSIQPMYQRPAAKYLNTRFTPFQWRMVGWALWRARRLIAKAMSGHGWLARYINAPTADSRLWCEGDGGPLFCPWWMSHTKRTQD